MGRLPFWIASAQLEKCAVFCRMGAVRCLCLFIIAAFRSLTLARYASCSSSGLARNFRLCFCPALWCLRLRFAIHLRHTSQKTSRTPSFVIRFL